MALSRDLQIKRQEGVLAAYPVKTATEIFKGSMVCVDTNGYALPAVDNSGYFFVGIASEYVNNTGANGAKWISVYRSGLFELPASSITQAHVGDIMYVVNDGEFDETTPANSVVCGRLQKYISATRGVLDISFGTAIGASYAATAVSVADSANYFEAGATTVEAVLAEIGAELAIYNKVVVVPWAVVLEDGTALTKFSAAPTPGFAQINTSKEVVLKHAKHANPGEAAALFILPDDLDGTAAVEFHIMGLVDGTDTPTITTECYIGYNDTDCGGATTEMTAGANTMNAEYVSIAQGNVPDAGPAPVTVVFNPTDGELGNDNCYIYGMWLEYTKKKA